jgi:glutaredoxin 3
MECVAGSEEYSGVSELHSGHDGLDVSSSSKGDWDMEKKRRVEIYSAGCGCCEDTIALVKKIACPSCEITIHDMKNREIAERAKLVGVRTVPAVVIDGKLAVAVRIAGRKRLLYGRRA